MEQWITVLTFIVVVAYVVVDKFVIPNVGKDTIESATTTVTTVVDVAQKLEIVITMAKQFVVLAKAEMKDATGEEKRNWVIEKLKTLCNGLDFVIDEDQLRAINEGAYSEMVKKEE